LCFRSVFGGRCLTFREQTKLRRFRIYRETLSRFRAPLHKGKGKRFFETHQAISYTLQNIIEQCK
ncbi:hypothetical protein AAHB56_27975, partial [Bacillus thuringiensis]